jgi:hypothetical protein
MKVVVWSTYLNVKTSYQRAAAIEPLDRCGLLTVQPWTLFSAPAHPYRFDERRRRPRPRCVQNRPPAPHSEPNANGSSRSFSCVAAMLRRPPCEALLRVGLSGPPIPRRLEAKSARPRPKWTRGRARTTIDRGGVDSGHRQQKGVGRADAGARQHRKMARPRPRRDIVSRPPPARLALMSTPRAHNRPAACTNNQDRG